MWNLLRGGDGSRKVWIEEDYSYATEVQVHCHLLVANMYEVFSSGQAMMQRSSGLTLHID